MATTSAPTIPSGPHSILADRSSSQSTVKTRISTVQITLPTSGDESDTQIGAPPLVGFKEDEELDQGTS